MKYIITSIFMVCSFTLMSGITACSPDDTEPPTETPALPEVPVNTENMKVDIKIGDATFTATLQSNQTATAFKEMLPLTISMSELNNNEKYYNFSGSFPIAPTRPGTIRSGDLMLYGNNCLVLFYKTFTTSYSYTTIGAIDNPAGLEAAVGSGNITVTYSLTDK